MEKHLVLILFLNSFLIAQSLRIPQIKFAPAEYVCYHSCGSINIDGKLNESCWSKAPWTENFVDIRGPLGNIPKFRTRVKILWDEFNLYIASELQEPNITGTLKKHDDAILTNNNFEIFIDPDGDTHNYYEIEINALNTVWDLILLKPYRDIKQAALSAWDMKGLVTAVYVNGTLNNPADMDSFWTVEAAIPWKAFKELSRVNLPPKDGEQWRLNFSRVEWNNQGGCFNNQQQQAGSDGSSTSKPDYWVWSAQGVLNMHYPELWGYVQFSRDTAGRRIAEFNHQGSEAAKWFLRQIYYKEKNYYARNGKYTSDLHELGIEAPQLPGFVSGPVIECTQNLFEVYIDSENHLSRIHIRNDGLVWMSAIRDSENN